MWTIFALLFVYRFFLHSINNEPGKGNGGGDAAMDGDRTRDYSDRGGATDRTRQDGSHHNNPDDNGHDDSSHGEGHRDDNSHDVGHKYTYESEPAARVGRTRLHPPALV